MLSGANRKSSEKTEAEMTLRLSGTASLGKALGVCWGLTTERAANGPLRISLI